MRQGTVKPGSSSAVSDFYFQASSGFGRRRPLNTFGNDLQVYSSCTRGGSFDLDGADVREGEQQVCGWRVFGDDLAVAFHAAVGAADHYGGWVEAVVCLAVAHAAAPADALVRMTRLDAVAGSRVLVTGLLIGTGGADGINVTTVSRVAPKFHKETGSAGRKAGGGPKGPAPRLAVFIGCTLIASFGRQPLLQPVWLRRQASTGQRRVAKTGRIWPMWRSLHDLLRPRSSVWS